MAPIIEVNNSALERLEKLSIEYSLVNKNNQLKDTKDFIYVPSINLYVAKERTHLRKNWFDLKKNWFDCHKLLQQENKRMMIIPEFIEFLKYTKENYKDIYNEITEIKSPWRGEWLDANFEAKDNELYINFNHRLNSDGSLTPKNSEILDENTLMRDKSSGISLEDWLENPIKQGLPTNKTVKKGNLSYTYPRSYDNSVAMFDASEFMAGLDCNMDPSTMDDFNLGVRAVKIE